MLKSDAVSDAPINGMFSPGGGKRGAHIAEAAATMRRSKPATNKSRISAAKAKRGRVQPLGPTPERLQHGDVVTVGGMHRSISTVEKLRDQDKLDHDAKTNQAMFEAAQKLQRHFAGSMIGVKAQDLDRVIATGADGLEGEEAWVHHYDSFRAACRLMGWSDANPKRGAGRIVVQVTCYEQTVGDAALAVLGSMGRDALFAIGMDRLREGLYALARHWKFC